MLVIAKVEPPILGGRGIHHGLVIVTIERHTRRGVRIALPMSAVVVRGVQTRCAGSTLHYHRIVAIVFGWWRESPNLEGIHHRQSGRKQKKQGRVGRVCSLPPSLCGLLYLP